LSPCRIALAVVAVAALLSGCGRSDAAPSAATPGKQVQTLDLPGLPSSLGTPQTPGDLLGLAIKKEDVAEPVSRVPATFIDGLALYSLRHDDLVQATLQVTRFNSRAKVASATFRQAVVNQIGSSTPRPFRLGPKTVYLTTGTKQSIAVWFSGRYMLLLASRSDYDEPRTLLRKALELQP
jgi:hypothetical protein